MSEGFYSKKSQGLHKIGHNSSKILKTQGAKTQNSSKNSKLKQKTQGFGKTKNAVCRKSVEKKAVNYGHYYGSSIFLYATQTGGMAEPNDFA